jgi:hypothetical protein
MKTGGRVSQALKRLLREFRAQGYALLQRNSNNLVYVCAAGMETAPPFNCPQITLISRTFGDKAVFKLNAREESRWRLAGWLARQIRAALLNF